MIFFCLVPKNKAEKNLKKFLNKQEQNFEDIAIQRGMAKWNINSDEGEADQDTLKQRFCELFCDDKINSTIEEWYKKRKTMKDLTLKRRVEIWHNVLPRAKVDFNEEIFKLENQIEAWIMSKDISDKKPSDSELRKSIRKLMKLRNEKAQELGYLHYPYFINGCF